MARLTEHKTKDTLPPTSHAAYDAIAAARNGVVRGPFAVMLPSPEVASRAMHLGTYVRFESTLTPRVRELAALTVACECKVDYERVAHTHAAPGAGVPPEAIDAVLNGKSEAGLAPEDASIVKFTRTILREHRVDDATFKAVQTQLGEQPFIDFMATVGYYAMLAVVIDAVEVAPAD
jgi:4-carboxymuconolactone decarboxylase